MGGHAAGEVASAIAVRIIHQEMRKRFDLIRAYETGQATRDSARTPSVGGIALAGPGESLSAGELRRRANVELLRQAAIDAGLLAADDPPPTEGAISQAAASMLTDLVAGRTAGEVAAMPKDELLGAIQSHVAK